MPCLKRQTGYYRIKRKLPGIGHVDRSLRTDRKGIADRREQALLAAHREGHHEVVRAFLDDEVSIHEVQEAYESNRVAELAREIRRGDATLGEAADAALADKAPDVKASTLNRYETGLDHFRSLVGDDVSVREALTTDRIQAFKTSPRKP